MKNKFRKLEDRKIGCGKGYFISNNSNDKSKRHNSNYSINKSIFKNSSDNFYNNSKEVNFSIDKNYLSNNPNQEYFVRNKFKKFFV